MACSHPVFNVLGDISAYCVNQDILVAAQNLQHKKYDPVMHLMTDATTLVKVDVSSNPITQFERALTLHYYFKNSIEGTAP